MNKHIYITISWIYLIFIIGYGWNQWGVHKLDFPSFWAAAQITFNYSSSPYFREALQVLIENGTPVYPYLYPPPALIIFYPFSLGNINISQNIHLIVTHMLIVAVILTVAYTLTRDKIARASVILLSAVVILLSMPTASTILYGQINFLLLITILLFALFENEKKHGWAGFFLCIAILLKTYPVLLVLLLFTIGRKKACLWTFYWLVAFTLASLLLLPNSLSLWSDWFKHVIIYSIEHRTPRGLWTLATPDNHSFNGHFLRAYGVHGLAIDGVYPREFMVEMPNFPNPSLGKYLTLVTNLSVVVSTVLILLTTAKKDPHKQVEKLLILGLPAICLIAPITWGHHLVLLYPVMLLLILTGLKENSKGNHPYIVLLLLICITIVVPTIPPIKMIPVLGLWAIGTWVCINKSYDIPQLKLPKFMNKRVYG